MKRAIITDSTFYFTKEERASENIFQVATTIHFKDTEYKEEGDLIAVTKDIFNIVQERKIMPKTSQPSTYAWISIIKEVQEMGYDIIDIFIVSSKLSGTYQGACLVVNELNNEKINIYDTNTAVQLTVIIVREVLRLESEMKKVLSKNEIQDIINYVNKHGRIHYIISDLKYLKYSGRMSGSKLLLSNLLNVKLILNVEDGNLVLASKERSLKKAILKITEDFSKEYEPEKEYYCIGSNVLNHDTAKEFYDQVYNMIKTPIGYEMMPLGPSMSIHAGLNTIGVAWCSKYKK